MRDVDVDGTFAGWRRAARAALQAGYEPTELRWRDSRGQQPELGLAQSTTAEVTGTPKTLPPVPRGFLHLAEEVACHRAEDRWARLYAVLWRLTHGEPHLLEVATDEQVHVVRAMAKAVQRDVHKMRAFVRFREVAGPDGVWNVAWFEPQHFIVEANAPFFRDRFAALRWSILTPDRCAHWDGRELTFTPGVDRAQAPTEDATEDLWRTYYAHIFNPARLKVGAMRAQMPQHYWANLPEAELIPGLIAEARPRSLEMVARSEAERAGLEQFSRAPVPDTRDLVQLQAAAAGCQACPLWRKATCTVFGVGAGTARVVVVGEQPGDQEDRQGRPFVGPAGQLFDRALAAAGIARETLYLTNAVKHFKWEPRGKRRLHQRPSAREVAACRPWLEAELRALQPRLIVCLGGTAAETVLQRPVRILEERGTQVPTEFGAPALLTLHPAALLRLPAEKDAEAEFAAWVEDLRQIAEVVKAEG